MMDAEIAETPLPRRLPFDGLSEGRGGIMTGLDDLLHPVLPERFMAEYHGQKPLHIPAGPDAPKRAVMDWSRFNVLLSQTSTWNAASLRMARDGEPVLPEEYCINVNTPAGLGVRPSPEKVEVLLSSGASLIANDITELMPEVSAVAGMLGRRFAAAVVANAYCSFDAVQAFGTHFDLHDVFAVHVEGEKTWRLYQNRADCPVVAPGDGADPRPFYNAARGPLMQEVRMKPGDVLYLPRGWYHDALAEAGSASLHVTFSVTPLYGRIIFNLLEQAAMQDSAFRAYLPPADQAGGAPLRAHLADLGRRLAILTSLPQFVDEIAMTQERLVSRPARYALPTRKPLTLYSPTGLMPPQASGPAAIALSWAYRQPVFALEDLCARFDFVQEAALCAAVTQAEEYGALRRT